MKVKDKSLIPLTVLVGILAVIAAGLLIVVCLFHVVDFQLYPRNAQVLDLRDKAITVHHYEKLKSALPECEIHWNIPFQGGTLEDGTETVTISSLTEEDALALSYAPELKTVNADACTDYPQLMLLRQLRPEVQVRYQVTVGGESFPADSKAIRVTGASEEEVVNLQFLTELTQVVASGSGDFEALRDYCQYMDLDFALELGGSVIPHDAGNATVTGLADESLPLFAYMPNLTQLHLVNPQADAEAVLALSQTYPGLELTCQVELAGETYTTGSAPAELDLSDEKITDLEALEKALSYLPEVEQVYLGECGLDNELLSQYRDRVREDYKVVWALRLSKKGKLLRTDITYFFPARDGYIFNDKTSHNLRYCEDLICVDVGHLGVSDTSFLETLVNLEYLILAHTGVQYIDGIENCKKLKYLELDWTGIRDLTPLLECTALEDLNIGKTWPDVTPLTQMPWLKHVYMIMGNVSQAWKITQACPDTRVVTSGTHTVSSGWRSLPNYYAMRDALHANYMN